MNLHVRNIAIADCAGRRAMILHRISFGRRMCNILGKMDAQVEQLHSWSVFLTQNKHKTNVIDNNLDNVVCV